ncbi:MAG: AraC family transcriptional regulator [Candidatus Dactylopiibacterium sp.]|nr:AraC family transcriptional regulator [Candidatus Dactylopiibacterium sp.]
MDQLEKQDKEGIVRGADLAEAAGLVASSFRVLTPGAGGAGVALHGDYRLVRLRSGLVLHATDAYAARDITTETVQRQGLSCYLFLKGHVDATLGGLAMHLGPRRTQRGDAVEGLLVARAEPDVLVRHGSRGDTVRKVSVNISQEWLEGGGFDASPDYRRVAEFCRSHLATRRWAPSPRMLALASQLVHPPALTPMLQSLYLESQSLELAAEALRVLSRADHEAPVRLVPREHARMRRVRDLLDSGAGDAMSLEDIARHFCTNANTLQRNFRAAFGDTVFAYLRHHKLEQARRALESGGITVAQAAELAGYQSPANFATAYRRRFGIAPSKARSRC